MGGTWTKIKAEIDRSQQDFDGVRRRLIADLAAYTGRNTIIYVSDFLVPGRGKSDVELVLSDKVGFQEVIENLTGDSLDIVIESPGGSPEAAESIVSLLRDKFSDIRFIVPNIAKSAATMLALSGNSILMDQRSELGPTDPQLVINRDGNHIMAPAQAILDQFQKANTEILANPACLPTWIPILNHYAPALLKTCENALALAKQLVATWLERYMFVDDSNAAQKAATIANFFANNQVHLSHGKMIGIGEAKELGLKVIDMRTDPVLQQKVWELYQAIVITFQGTPASKIFENQMGDALIRLSHVAQMVELPVQIAPQHLPPNGPQQGNRQQRRQNQRNR